LIFTDRPFVWARHDEPNGVRGNGYSHYCSTCGVHITDPVTAKRCDSGCLHWYCGESCCAQDRSVHAWLCEAYQEGGLISRLPPDPRGHVVAALVVFAHLADRYRRDADALLEAMVAGVEGAATTNLSELPTPVDAVASVLEGYQMEDYCRCAHAFRSSGSLEPPDEGLFQTLIAPGSQCPPSRAPSTHIPATHTLRPRITSDTMVYLLIFDATLMILVNLFKTMSQLISTRTSRGHCNSSKNILRATPSGILILKEARASLPLVCSNPR
jgi:hypothetical protein